jgi:DNA repair protein RadC
MKYCTRTITWRFAESREELPELFGKKEVVIRRPEDIASNYMGLFRDQVKERFIVFWLSASNKVMGFEIVTEGILNSSLVHPREVFRGAIVATCAAVIVAHNHPSGSTEPSPEDLNITRQIFESGRVIGIPVHDHIIFAGDSYTSFLERGLL